MILDDRTMVQAILALFQDITDKELFDDLKERAKVFLSISRIIRAEDYSDMVKVFIDRGWTAHQFTNWIRANHLLPADTSGLRAAILDFPEWIRS